MLAIVILAVVIHALQGCATVPADKTTVVVTPDATPFPDCAHACLHLAALGCQPWTSDGVSCEQGCTSALESLGAWIDLECIVGAPSCKDAERCVW